MAAGQGQWFQKDNNSKKKMWKSNEKKKKKEINNGRNRQRKKTDSYFNKRVVYQWNDIKIQYERRNSIRLGGDLS